MKYKTFSHTLKVRCGAAAPSFFCLIIIPAQARVVKLFFGIRENFRTEIELPPRPCYDEEKAKQWEEKTMKVAGIGSLNIDYVYQMAHFIRPGETAPCKKLTIGCGGKGLNQSVALAQAGAETYHVGLRGQEGKFLEDKLREKGVDTRFLKPGEGSNGHAIIQVDEKGQNCIILHGGTNRQFTEGFVDEVLTHFGPGDIAVLQNEINLIPYIIDKCHEKGMKIAFNAAPYDEAIKAYPLGKVDWLIVNEVEGGGLSGKTEYGEIADELLRLYPNTNVVLTMGKAGCMYRSKTERCALPACRVQAVDTPAAGDTFIGYFVRGVTLGLPVAETLRLATAASAICVTRPGAADSVPAYEEVVSSQLYRSM
jgi:ribokinase